MGNATAIGRRVFWGDTMKEAASKHIDGIADLVVVAPIKDGFIKAFETISYASRLELAANALNRVRVAAREYERVTPFSDVTERILSLLDFRVGVIDKDLFGFVPDGADKLTPSPKRYLYLTATFEGGFEPYMRQIWRPLGPFLDLLFCNCEGYVTATEHSFEEYMQWVRDNQMDSAIFYNTTGVTVRDQKYLAGLERAQRNGKTGEELAKLSMHYPEDDATATRLAYPEKTIELGFEALNVLHKLADYYPPEWMTGPIGEANRPNEGHRLLRVTREILSGWDPFLHLVEQAAAANPNGPQAGILAAYAAPLGWYKSGTAYVAELDARPLPPDPLLDRRNVQSGILKAHGSAETPVRQGTVMLFSVRHAEDARSFVKSLMERHILRFDGDGNHQSANGLIGNIAFTPQGLLEMGMFPEILDRFPKEFREGLAQRSGLVGDMRENHPRNWILPERNGPALVGLLPAEVTLPPVELNEVDFILQLRSSEADAAAFRAAAITLAKEATGATLEAVEWLHVDLDNNGRFRDHFGFVDGISQPRPRLPDQGEAGLPRDAAALGEVLLGYGNDRGDGPPAPFDTLDGPGAAGAPNSSWRHRYHEKALSFQKDGSYLVVRKIGENVPAFEAWLDREKNPIAEATGWSAEEAKRRLKAAIMGRNEDGTPLVTPISADLNDFDYRGDAEGLRCPHAAHIRRANPRRTERDLTAPPEVRREFDRPTPRLVRRGMLLGKEGDASRGLMFMAYASSISEQYEVIQRWLNGGNPTDVSSANNDPLTGVRPKDGEGAFRFVATCDRPDGTHKEVVLSIPLPPADQPPHRNAEPGRHPFTPLYWGLYLFAPSRSALTMMTEHWKDGYKPLGEFLEKAVGDARIARLWKLDEKARAQEWKRILEDFMTKDPSERDISPHVWAAIRYYAGGVLDLDGPLPFHPAEDDARDADGRRPNPPCSDLWRNPDWETQRVKLCAGLPQVMKVLADWDNFTSEEQLRRIMPNAGPIYVTQQPDDRYICLSGEHHYAKPDGSVATQALNYHEESAATNAALLHYPEDQAFRAGYAAGKAVLDARKRAAQALGRSAFKLEMRREYFQPAIAEIWKTWYGLPDDEKLFAGSWSWKRIVETVVNGDLERKEALCPGDFMAPSRGSVFPRPNASIRDFAQMHGSAILEAGRAFVARHRTDPTLPKTPLIQKLFAATPDDEVLARNIIGTMIGAIPPMEANLRNILFEWLQARRLWRHQSAYLTALAGSAADTNVDAALEALEVPVAQAMCIRPAPDMLFRTAKRRTKIKRYGKSKDELGLEDAMTAEGEMLVVSLASASQWSLHDDPSGTSGIDVIFGGKRTSGSQGYTYGPDGVFPPNKHDDYRPAHACPAQAMAMGGMKGILAALLEAGSIQALPASLILRISDW